MGSSNKRPIAILHMKTLLKIGNFIERMRLIVHNIGDNAILFPTPTPLLATVTTHIDDLETAEDDAKQRKAGTVAARNLKYNIVLNDGHALLAYVQLIADNAGNEDGAIAIIAASGFEIKQHGIRVKPDFSVKNTKVSGIVELIAKAHGSRSSNEWGMSDDRIVWTNLPSTLEAKTTVSGLTPGTIKYFRHRPVLKGTTPSGWSQIVSIVVT